MPICRRSGCLIQFAEAEDGLADLGAQGFAKLLVPPQDRLLHGFVGQVQLLGPLRAGQLALVTGMPKRRGGDTRALPVSANNPVMHRILRRPVAAGR
jgi:hypothetical protein